VGSEVKLTPHPLRRKEAARTPRYGEPSNAERFRIRPEGEAEREPAVAVA
jgi:hypothetical protein